MAAPPTIAIPIEELPIEELPIDIIVDLDTESRSKRLSDLNAVAPDNRFEVITKVKLSLLPESYDAEPHKCWLQFKLKDRAVRLLCCTKHFFDEGLAQYLQEAGQNLRFSADFRNIARTTSRTNLHKQVARLLDRKSTVNYDDQRCLFDVELQRILFGENNLLRRIINEDPSLAARIQKVPNLFSDIRENGKKLLALLILANKEQQLGQLFLDFWDQGYRDDAIPFQSNERPTFCDEDTWMQVIPFQHRFTVAELTSLKDENRFHDFSKTQPLPFMHMSPVKEGGFGDIFKVDLAKENREIYRLVGPEGGKNYESNPSLAVKRLNERSGRTTADFRQETSILVKLESTKHPHIVRLITAFRHGEHYYLCFPLAKCDLEKILKESEPERSLEHIRWILGQMSKVSDALKTIHSDMKGTSTHILRPTRHFQRGHQNLAVPGTAAGQNLSLRDDNFAESDEVLKGVHNDLAPGNLLLFYKLDTRLERDEAKYGRMVISDFGLAKLRRKIDGSRSKNIKGQPNYLSPESEAERPEERYQDQWKDIWCLGAILLQILVWLEGGSDALANFDSKRSGTTNSACPETEDQGFFTYSQSEKRPMLRPAVVEQLECLPESTNWLHDAASNETLRVQQAVNGVIKLIRQCFDFKPKKRPTAGQLSESLKRICEQLATSSSAR